MRRIGKLFAASMLIGALTIGYFAQPAFSEVSGRQRIIRMDNTHVEGDVEEVGDAYKVTVKPGIVVTVPKNMVRTIMPIANAGATTVGGKPTAAVDTTLGVPDDVLQRIIGDEGEATDDDDVAGDILEPLPLNEKSVEEMKRMAGPSAKLYTTDHFAFVYTSDAKFARSMAARLTSVYRWCHRYMVLLGIPQQRPDYKLEMFLFATYKEYEAFQTNNGFKEMGAIGFYMRTHNRSAFFDMMTWPPFAQYHEQLKDPRIPFDRRRDITNLLNRKVEHMNLEVVQHEAAHHIHFNIGIFPKRGDLPRWMTEGLAQMFETPTTAEAGGSLGALNHYRLNEWRQMFGEKGDRMPEGWLRQFILDDRLMFGMGAAGYPPAWSIHHYMWKKRREPYAKYMRLMAAREDDVEIEMSERAKEFEDLFGEFGKFEKDYKDFLNTLSVKRSILPPD